MRIIIPNLRSTITIEAEKIETKPVTAFGNGAKIDFWKKYENRNVFVIVPIKSKRLLRDGKK